MSRGIKINTGGCRERCGVHAARLILLRLAPCLLAMTLGAMGQAPASAQPEPSAGSGGCPSWADTDRVNRNAIRLVRGAMVLEDFLGGIPVYHRLSVEGASVDPARRGDQRLAEFIVKIDTQGSSGSGVIISSTGGQVTVLTSAHVVNQYGPADLAVRVFDGGSLPVKSVNYVTGSDLAELIVESSRCFSAVPLARSLESDIWSKTRKTSFGEDVFILGFPADSLQLKRVEAQALMQSYSAKSRANGYAIMYHYGDSLGTEVGMSGSPVLDINGYLVGIHGQVDVIGGAAQKQAIRTGYGLAVPVNAWLNARSDYGYVENRIRAIDYALIGAYQLSTGALDQSIQSLSKAIEQSIGEHRSLSRARREAYQREVLEPFRDVLSAEAQCKQEQERERDMRPYFPNPMFSPDSPSEQERKYEYCVSTRKLVEDMSRRQHELENANRAAAEAAMSFDGSHQHLYALRSFAYAAKGRADQAKADRRKCLELAGGVQRRSGVCSPPGL